MGNTLLRRPGSIASTVAGSIMCAVGLLLGLAGLVSAGAPGLGAGAFAPLGAGMIWWGRVSGLRVTSGAEGSVVTINGVFRKRICAAAPVTAVAVLKVGTVWDAREVLRFLDGGGNVLGEVVNLFPSRYSQAAWTHDQIRSFGDELRWRVDIDTSDSHVSHPPPQYTDDES